MQRRVILSCGFAAAVAGGVVWRRPLFNALDEARYRHKITAIPRGTERAEVLRALASLKKPFYTEVKEIPHEVLFMLRLLEHRQVTGPWETSGGRLIRWTFKFDASDRLIDVKEDTLAWSSAT